MNATEQQIQDARLARRIATHAKKLGSSQAWTMVERTFIVSSFGVASESLVLLMNTQEPGSGFFSEVRRLIDPTARGMTARMIEDDFKRAATDFVRRYQTGAAP